MDLRNWDVRHRGDEVSVKPEEETDEKRSGAIDC